jgi:protein arginine kinase activator
MLCQKCGKNTATTHIKTVINGKVTEQNLCGYCADKDGYSGFSGGSITNLLASMLGQSMKLNTTASTRHCSCCGATFADIAETGKVGCGQCYTEFGEELLPYLKRIHGSTRHNGKTPGRKDLVVTQRGDDIAKLKEKLASLVACEKYEEAAVVRDEIKRMEGEK